MNKFYKTPGFIFSALIVIFLIFIGYISWFSELQYKKASDTYTECLNEAYDRAQMTHAENYNSDSWNGAYKSYTRDCMIRQGYPSGKRY